MIISTFLSMFNKGSCRSFGAYLSPTSACIRQLRGRLDALILQTDKANIKQQLVDIMNRLN